MTIAGPRTPLANLDGRVCLLAAMAYQEGWGPPANRPTRNNSPLDLVSGDEALRFGALLQSDGRYARFATVYDGFSAGRRWMSIRARFAPTPNRPHDPLGPNGYLIGGYLGATLRQAIYRFAPYGDGGNDPAAYVATCVRYTTFPGPITPDTVLILDLLTVPDTV